MGKPAMGIERTCMRDEIRDAIVAKILDGSYPPDTHLKEMVLAQEFNVSQAPVREALRELEALGLVQSERYCGTRVRGIDIDELREAYELRAEIEDAAARRAVPVSKEGIAHLEELLKRMRRLHKERDHEVFMATALDFHRSIVLLSGNRLYLRAWDNMAWDIRARFAAQRLGLMSNFDEERKQIVEALRNGDGKRAGTLLRGILGKLRLRLKESEIARAASADTQ